MHYISTNTQFWMRTSSVEQCDKSSGTAPGWNLLVWNQASSKHLSNLHCCWLLVACTLLQLPPGLSPVATRINIWSFQKLTFTATSNCLMYKHLHTKKPHNLLPEVWLMWKHFLTTMYSLLNRSALGAAIIRLRKLFTFTNVSSSNLPLSSNDSWLKRSSPLLMERLISDCKYRRYDKEAHPKSNAAGLYIWRTDHLRGS